MRIFIFLLIRMVTLAVSYVITSLTASLFVVFVLFLGSDASWLEEDIVVAGSALVFAATLWWQVAQLAFAPFCLIVLGLELGRFRSLVMNSLAGGLCALVVLTLFETAPIETDLPYSDREFWTVGLASGFVAGLVHWLIAGHRAGVWMGTPINEPEVSD